MGQTSTRERRRSPKDHREYTSARIGYPRETVPSFQTQGGDFNFSSNNVNRARPPPTNDVKAPVNGFGEPLLQPRSITTIAVIPPVNKTVEKNPKIDQKAPINGAPPPKRNNRKPQAKGKQQKGSPKNEITPKDQPVLTASDKETLKRMESTLNQDTTFPPSVIQIEMDSHHTYEELFGQCMGKDTKIVKIEEPYIFFPWQIHNLIRFLECCVINCPSLKLVKLVTKVSDKPDEQASNFRDLSTSLKNHKINFVVEYGKDRNNIHDRSIV